MKETHAADNELHDLIKTSPEEDLDDKYGIVRARDEDWE